MSDFLIHFNKKKCSLPLIGLRQVMECSAINQEVFYICKVCTAMICKKNIIHHVTGLCHRVNYIKQFYPSWLKNGAKKQDSYTLKLARIVQNKEGIGDVQLVALDEVLHKRLSSMSNCNVLKHLQMIVEEQSRDKGQTGQKGAMGVNNSPSLCPELASKQRPHLLCLHDAIKTCEVVPSSEAPQKHSQDPKQQEAKLHKKTCEEEARRLQVQVPVSGRKNSTQSPGLPEQPEPLFKDAELKQVAVKQEPVEFPTVPQCPDTAPFSQKAYGQMPPLFPPQDSKWAVHNRVDIPVGESHFSKFMLSLVAHKRAPLVGLRAVMECRSFKQPTFYLCLTCAEKVSRKHICNHIISDHHQYCYIQSQYPELVEDWEENPTGVAWWVRDNERANDVQVMKLDLNLYNEVASVPIGVALDLLLVARRQQNQSFLQPFETPGLRPIIGNDWTLPPQEVSETPVQNPYRTELSRDGPSPPYSVSVSEKRHQDPGLPQEPSQDLMEAERQRAAEEESVLAQASPWEPWLNLKGTETDKVPEEKAVCPPLDLQSYMEDPCRTQPLVGLSALIECRCEKQMSFYLCLACCILLKTRVIEHMIGPKHRNSYLLKRRPDLFRQGSTPQDSTKKSSYLLEMAKEVELEERGNVREIQKLRFDSATYAKVKSMPFDEALNLVQTVFKQQNHSDLKTHVTPAQGRVMVKQEKVENEECTEESIQDTQIMGSGTSRLKGWSQDAPQEPVLHPKMRGTGGSPGVGGTTNAVTVPAQEGHSGSGALIGLQRVIKCVNVDGWPPPFYLCQACSIKVTGDRQSIIKHLTSGHHQYFYIKSHHPKRLEKEKEAGGLTCGMADLVQFVAKKLEEEEGSGSFQVINMSKEVYEILGQRNYEHCMEILKGCNGMEESQSCIKPENGNSAQHTASSCPGQTLQNSGPQSGSSRHGPPTLCPMMPNGHSLAEMRNQESTGGSQRLNHTESPRAFSTHHPSAPTGCPSLERGPSQPFMTSIPEQQTANASEPRARTPGCAWSSCDPMSQPASLSFTKFPPVKTGSQHHPSRAESSLANERKSSAIQSGIPGQQISTVTQLHPPMVVRGLSTMSAGNRRHGAKAEASWDYENRQFTSQLFQAKQIYGAKDSREGAPDHHPSDGAPTPARTQIHLANRSSVTGPSEPEQEFLSFRSQTVPCEGVQSMDMNSSSECLKNDGRSKNGTRRIVVQTSSAGAPQSTHLTTTACPKSTSAGRVPQSVLGKRRQQSLNTANITTTTSSSDFDPPPVKIPVLDCGGLKKSPTERSLTCWKK